MAATYEDIIGWILRGLEKEAVYVISVCDTFDHSDYPVFVMPNEDHQAVVRSYNAKEMQKVNEVIFLDDPFDDMVTEAKKRYLKALEESSEADVKTINDKIMERVVELNDPGTQYGNTICNENIFPNGKISFRRDVEMNAKRARELTEQNILQDSNTIKVKIDQLIEEAIAKKSFSIKFDVPPATEKDILKKHYIDLGFTWKQNQGGDQRDPYPASITLSW